jgi:ferredoxin
MENIITIYVEEADGSRTPIEVPTDVTLNLMEVLKGSDYPIKATCGGMALCATCHIEVLEGEDFKEATDLELDQLDTLPITTATSRLACQIRVREDLDGLVIRVLGDGQED